MGATTTDRVARLLERAETEDVTAELADELAAIVRLVDRGGTLCGLGTAVAQHFGREHEYPG